MGQTTMIEGNKTIPLAAILVAIAAPPAFGDAWDFRPGLWEIANIPDVSLLPLSPNISPETKAQLEKLTPPKPSTTQVCISSGSPMKSILDPANHPPGACTETVISESQTDRETEDVCTGLGPPLQGRRHTVLTGSVAGLIDQADITVGAPGNRLTKHFRWLSPDCGAAPPN
jgi:hypothetical protein